MLPWYKRAAGYILGLLLAGGTVEQGHAQEPVKVITSGDSLKGDSIQVSVIESDSLSQPVDTITALAETDSTCADTGPLPATTFTWSVPDQFLTIYNDSTFHIETMTMGWIYIPEPKTEELNWKFFLDSLYNRIRPHSIFPKSAGKQHSPAFIRHPAGSNQPPGPLNDHMPNSEAIMATPANNRKVKSEKKKQV